MSDTGRGGRDRRRPDGAARVDEFVAVANVLMGVCGGVYNATRSTVLAVVALGMFIVCGLALSTLRR